MITPALSYFIPGLLPAVASPISGLALHFRSFTLPYLLQHPSPHPSLPSRLQPPSPYSNPLFHLNPSVSGLNPHKDLVFLAFNDTHNLIPKQNLLIVFPPHSRCDIRSQRPFKLLFGEFLEPVEIAMCLQ
ncbi:hypothetical protein B0T13DRAFT_279864 [Neurospora crassa]|nr:hypothetical protein B0T13DRAFT_279864 [Neurospora crassa]